jgi:hypothetical protein
VAGLGRQLRDDYEEFLVEIPMLLEDLDALMAHGERYQGARATFDDDGIERVELFYREVLEGREDVGVSPNRLDRIMLAYLGQAVISRAGGTWDLHAVEGDPAFGTPVVVEWGTTGDYVRFSPVEWLEELKKQGGRSVREFIDYAIHQEDFERGLFGEED